MAFNALNRESEDNRLVQHQEGVEEGNALSVPG